MVPTPRRPKVVRYRPTWHRVIGGVELGVALILVLLYYGEGVGYHVLPVPPTWDMVAGITIAYYSTVWFGWWDRPR